MSGFLTDLAVAFGGLATLGALWVGLQAAVRRWFPSMATPAGEDPFRPRFGCGGCAGGACETEPGPAAR